MTNSQRYKQFDELRRQRKWREALAAGEKLLAADDQDTHVWLALSDINVNVGRYGDAVSQAKTAVALEPDNLGGTLQFTKCLIADGRKVEALAVLDGIRGPVPSDAKTNDAIGTLYSICDEPARASRYYEVAVGKEPDNPTYRSNLALVQRMMGELGEAEANFDKVVATNPNDFRAYYSRSDLRAWTAEENHIPEMEQRLSQAIKDWRGKATLGFALAKEYDDLKRYDESFEHLERACTLHRSHMRYSVQNDISAMAELRRLHTRSALGSLGDGFQSKEPIFVLGLPRTGTTLVDRIIGNHPDVYSAGELNNFTTKLVSLSRGGDEKSKLSKLEMVEAALRIDFHELGEAYVQSTRPKTGHTPRFTDKFPFNYLNCGLIGAALPKAKLILLDRHPMDACFAMYRMMFMGIYPFSYDLRDLGHYYVEYQRLATHWQSVLGDRLHVVAYEDLVRRPEAMIRDLLSKCELRWDEACLNFHKNPAASTTASAVQVRRPMYTSSIGKWENYRRQLEPLSAILSDAGVSVEPR